MSGKILNLTKQFIALKSTFDNQQALDDILNMALSQLEGFTIERFDHNGVKSALIYSAKTRPDKFKVILNGHLDVVPGKDQHYKAVLRNNRLFGVGSLDMKASVACLIFTFKDIATKVNYPLGLQLVTDEEIGGFNGTKHQIDQGVRTDFVIAGEPTNLDIVNRTKGILCLKISCQGKTAHGAYPWKGENAIWKMNTFLNVLKHKFPPLSVEGWTTSVNLSKIETTNQSFNKIPNDCTIWLDIRFIPEDANTILEDIKKLIPSKFRLEIVVHEPAIFVQEDNEFITNLRTVVNNTTGIKPRIYGAHGSSDVRHFVRVNGQGAEFGPKGGNIGADNEWVDVNSLNKYCLILKEFLLSI